MNKPRRNCQFGTKSKIKMEANVTNRMEFAVAKSFRILSAYFRQNAMVNPPMESHKTINQITKSKP
jgi:hypothetical protein